MLLKFYTFQKPRITISLNFCSQYYTETKSRRCNSIGDFGALSFEQSEHEMRKCIPMQFVSWYGVKCAKFDKHGNWNRNVQLLIVDTLVCCILLWHCVAGWKLKTKWFHVRNVMATEEKWNCGKNQQFILNKNVRYVFRISALLMGV